MDSSPSPVAGRTVVLGVSGGIAAYKSVEVCRRLVEAGAHVVPVLTDDAQRFVGALMFSALASEPARTSLFDAPEPIPHTHLGRRANLVLVAPATAKVIGKYAGGISDDLLTATLLATRAPVVVAPAMHAEMWEHTAVQHNVATLRSRGVHVIEPEIGLLAGGDVGAGRFPEPERIVEVVEDVLRAAGDLAGRRVLVTAGGTREAIDPVRVITNRSSGKQGHAIARAAGRRGAAVTLVTTADLGVPPGAEVLRVSSAAEMEAAVVPRAAGADVVIMAAAVADFRPKATADRKIKKENGPPEIALEPTHDFFVDLGRAKRPGQVLVGFAAETEHLVENARHKLREKNLDLVVANDVGAPDAGFEVDTNRAVVLDCRGGAQELPLMTKDELAEVVLDRVVEELGSRGANQP